MAVVISSKNQEKTFVEKEIINIGSRTDCDFVLNIGQEFLLTLQQNSNGQFVVVNNFMSNFVLFKGQPVGAKLEFDNVCRLMFANLDEFISIKVISSHASDKTISVIANEDLTENDMKGLYGADTNAVARVKLEKKKTDLEKQRVAIVKQTAFAINDLKKKLSLNFKTSLFIHVAMYLSALLLSFGVSNYLLGLKIEETVNFLHLPTNIKMLFVFSVIVYGICLIMKQGVYLYSNNLGKKAQSATVSNFMILVSALFFVGFYAINLVYFLQVNFVFSILISLLFVSLPVVFAIASGYFKYNGHKSSVELDKYEYREDFEAVINGYNQWIELYSNSLSNSKIRNIKDKLFNLQLKSFGEIILGVFTAPFLAYGVSNTLAMCFPEAAGWVRISGLRFSPVFLVLATFLIIFAFFAFVNAFLSIRKVQASNVIKQDGFSNYLAHGVNILGLQGIKKLETEKVRSLVIGIAIIFIEFTMNTSYFMTEIGGDFQGLFLSFVAASVPTALLIAETYMLSQTKFDIYVSEELIAKIDRD